MSASILFRTTFKMYYGTFLTSKTLQIIASLWGWRTLHLIYLLQLPLEDLADRVNLGFIPSSESSWAVACRLLRRDTGGVLHIHQNVTSPVCSTDTRLQDATATDRENGAEVDDETQVSQDAPSGTNRDRLAWKTWAEDTASRIAELLTALARRSWRTQIKHIENVKSYAPHIHHIVLDLECRPL